MTDPRAARLLFAGVALVCWVGSAGIPSANPGSHYALVRAMGDQASFVVDPYVSFTHSIDVARKDGHAYSNKSPVTAVLALPFYFLGRAWSRWATWPAYPVGHDAFDPTVPIVMLLPAIAGGLSAALVYAIARHLRAAPWDAVLAALSAAFGTLLWRYSTTLYSHAPSAAVLTGLVWATLGTGDRLSERARAALVGLLAGLAAAIEYSSVPAVAVVLLFVLATARRRWPGSAGEWARLGLLAAGAALPLLGLALYNHINFGSLTTTAYAFATTSDGGRNVVVLERLSLPGFSTPLGQGLGDLLLGTDKVEFPLLKTSPILLLAPLGWLVVARHSLSRALLLAAVPLALLLPMATFRAYWGGTTADTRYVVAGLPLLALPVAFVPGAGRPRARPLLRLALIALLGVSAFRVMNAVASFEGHPLREFRLPRSSWDLAADLSALFPMLAGSTEPADFVRWEWSRDGRAWTLAPAPQIGAPRLLARAFFRGGRELPREALFTGRGCLSFLSVNKVVRVRERCPGSPGPPWVVPLGGFVWPGLNLVEAEAEGDAELGASIPVR